MDVDQATPRVRIEAACSVLGRDVVIDRCVELLAGEPVDDGFVAVLGGAHARRLLAGPLPPDQAYWLRVWAARGMLWAGPGQDLHPLRQALTDGAWRVREMACKVIARHVVADLVTDVADLDSDPVPRVRAAAKRAVARIVDAGA
ncbi:MAG TPA: hypothetical protein VGA69_12400 [Nitriliruptorales bacterium]